jgi:aminoglycoside 3-N-acetyltransferase
MSPDPMSAGAGRNLSRSGPLMTTERLRQDLRACGLEAGMKVLVHSSLSSIGWVCGGPLAVVQALQEVVGPDGTVMMPAHTPENTEPSRWRNPPVPESWWAEIRRHMPAFDRECTPSQRMGLIAETFRKMPGVVRSDHPVGSFCAWGKHAAHLTSRHPLEEEFGDRSPLGRFYELDGRVLLLGVGYDRNTSLHLAEHRADFKGKVWQKEGCAISTGGTRRWVEYTMLALETDDFEAIGSAFETARPVQFGDVGAAPARLMRVRDLVDFAVDWMERQR